MSTINFGFGSTDLTFCFKFGHILGHFCPCFWSLGAIVGVQVRFKNIFGTYLCSQLTLVLEVQLYLVAFTSVKFGAFLPFLGLLGLFFWSLGGYFWSRGQVQKHFWNLLM